MNRTRKNKGGRPIVCEQQIAEITISAMHGCTQRHARRILAKNQVWRPDWLVIGEMLQTMRQCCDAENRGDQEGAKKILGLFESAVKKYYE